MSNSQQPSGRTCMVGAAGPRCCSPARIASMRWTDSRSKAAYAAGSLAHPKGGDPKGGEAIGANMLEGGLCLVHGLHRQHEIDVGAVDHWWSLRGRGTGWGH